MNRLFTAVLLVIPFAAMAADTTASPAPSFAMALYEDGEYGRALLEFQRHLFSRPDDPKIRYLTAVCRVRTGQLIRARSELRTIMSSPTPEGVRSTACNLYHYTWYAGGDYRTCLDSLPQGGDLSVSLSFLEIMTLCGLHRWDEAHRAVAGLDEQSLSPEQKQIAQRIKKAAEHALGIKRKSPLLSALLSVVPGLGSVYNGRYGDAAFAVGFTGLLYYAGWQAYDKDNVSLAAVFGGAAVTFHAGHIFGSAATARNGNMVKYRMALAALQKDADRAGWFRTFGLLPE